MIVVVLVVVVVELVVYVTELDVVDAEVVVGETELVIDVVVVEPIVNTMIHDITVEMTTMTITNIIQGNLFMMMHEMLCKTA